MQRVALRRAEVLDNAFDLSLGRCAVFAHGVLVAIDPEGALVLRA
ncbi:MAG: hypothetical protein P8Y73_07480 [Desulfuromonadales bacterium]